MSNARPRMPENGHAANAWQRLSALADQMEMFLLQQTGRFEAQLALVEDASATQAGLERLVEEFEQQREQWELQRQAEQSRLQQEGVALNEAWDRLEDAQRQLFAEQERIRSRAPDATLPARVRDAAASSTAGVQTARSRAPQTDSNAKAATNWWQLEQLRLEIQKHAMAGK